MHTSATLLPNGAPVYVLPQLFEYVLRPLFLNIIDKVVLIKFCEVAIGNSKLNVDLLIFQRLYELNECS